MLPMLGLLTRLLHTGNIKPAYFPAEPYQNPYEDFPVIDNSTVGENEKKSGNYYLRNNNKKHR